MITACFAEINQNFLVVTLKCGEVRVTSLLRNKKAIVKIHAQPVASKILKVD